MSKDKPDSKIQFAILNAELVDLHHPLSENGIISLSKDGLKSKIWGPKCWNFNLSLAFEIQSILENWICSKTPPQFEWCRCSNYDDDGDDVDQDRNINEEMFVIPYSSNLLVFYFKISFGSCGPCGACRNSHVEFSSRPNNNIYQYLQINQLPLWIYAIKNCVNQKLDKPFVPFRDVKQYYRENPYLWQNDFWYWIFIQVINYPIDVSWTAIKTETIEYSNSKSLLDRIKDYVTLIEQIKNLLPQYSQLYSNWIYCYFKNPPTVLTFQSRETLFAWLHGQQVGCRCTNLSLQETGKLYEQLRATSCKPEKKSCT